jgi:uncharacterized membrane protein
MQTGDFIDLVAWALIIIGAVIIISGIASMLMGSEVVAGEQQRESKGIILLGPIPIVWGYGKRVWIIASIVAAVLFVAAIILFP